MDTTTTPPNTLADAIREIERLSRLAVGPLVVPVAVSDGAGGERSIPVLVLPDEDGAATAKPLLDVLEAGSRLAEKQRLDHADGPDRRKGTATHQALQSFIDHANRFKAEHSAVWADPAGRKLVSVLDYHPAGAKSPARWGAHRGVYACPLSEAWQAWGGGKELVLDQDAFAALLDNRDRELASGKLPTGATAPDPAGLITLANSLEVYSTANAKRERDPNTGRVKISFSEENGVAGSVTPPPSFLIRIPVFQDAEPQLLEVRLRVTVQGGRGQFHVQIHAASDVLREEFDALCSRVASETSLPVFSGVPEV